VVRSTFSANNVHEVANDNSNPYRNMIMDAMRMNQGNVSQYPIVEEEPNANAARFFNLLKDSDEPLWNSYTNHSKIIGYSISVHYQVKPSVIFFCPTDLTTERSITDK